MDCEVVVCSIDGSLLRTRSQVLQEVGVNVLATEDPADMLPLIQTHSITALILCHTLTFEQQLRAITALRRYRPAAKSVVLTRDGSQDVPEGAHTSFSTALGPKAFVQTVKQLLQPTQGTA